MLRLCIGELAEIVGGQLTLGSLPPLAGVFEPLRRVVVDSRLAAPGDVFWALQGEHYVGARRAEDAFLRGALGVVVSGRHVEPWAGRFSLRVDDANAALLRLAQARPLRRRTPAPHMRHGSTTQWVESLLAGGAIRLERLLERLAQQGRDQTTRHYGVTWQGKEILEVPPTVS